MPLNQMRLHLPHGIEHDAYNDQQACSAEELSRDDRHIQPLAEQAWEHRDQRQKDCAGKSQARHGVIEEVRSRFSWPHPGDVASVFLQVVCDLSRLELRSDPEITEEE